MTMHVRENTFYDQKLGLIHIQNGLDQPSHCSPKKYIPIGFNVIFCKAQPSPIGTYTYPSRDRDSPTLVPTLIIYRNMCFVIQTSLYSKRDQIQDGSMEHECHTFSLFTLRNEFLLLLSQYLQTDFQKKKKKKKTDFQFNNFR